MLTFFINHHNSCCCRGLIASVRGVHAKMSTEVVGQQHFHDLMIIISTDRISRCSRGEASVQFGNLRIVSLLFADDVALFPSSDRDVWKCEVAGVRVSKS